MRTIIAGSRHIWDYAAVESAIQESGFEITTVVSGMARGVDACGWAWATVNNIPIKEYFPSWQLGKVAGHLRNAEMANNADALILVWDGKSNGSANMLRNAKVIGLKIFTKRINISQGEFELP